MFHVAGEKTLKKIAPSFILFPVRGVFTENARSMDYKKARQLAEIIVKIRLRHATQAERAVLNDWLDESEENRQTYKHIVRGEAIARRLRTEEALNRTVDFRQLQEIIARRLLRARRFRLLRWTGWSAAAAAVVGVVVYMAALRQAEPEFVPYAVNPAVIAAEPLAEAKTMLVTADGRQVDLERQTPDSIVSEQAVIRGEQGQLAYEEKPVAPQPDQREEWNKVITSVGGEYCVTLSDGTRVWLNANTELEFPVRFVRDKRVVYLKGEAYFEVARDEAKPFIVETNGMKTRVLGTSFNVKAYPDEREERATLLSGSVEVTLVESGPGDKFPRAVLEPGMQARWKSGRPALTVAPVNADDVVAWRRGEFVFDEEDIDVVLRALARWYGVQFVDMNPGAETYTFSGSFSKDDKLASSLEILTLAGGPDFRIEGNKVYMTKKKPRL